MPRKAKSAFRLFHSQDRCRANGTYVRLIIHIKPDELTDLSPYTAFVSTGLSGKFRSRYTPLWMLPAQVVDVTAEYAGRLAILVLRLVPSCGLEGLDSCFKRNQPLEHQTPILMVKNAALRNHRFEDPAQICPWIDTTRPATSWARFRGRTSLKSNRSSSVTFGARREASSGHLKRCGLASAQPSLYSKRI